MPRLYVELLCSLPRLANPFIHRRPPISEVQLLKRLNMLEFDDRALVRELALTFFWGRISVEDSDQAIVKRARRLIERVELEDLLDWLFWRMDYRTVIAALRRRHAGEEGPPIGTIWGYGPSVKHIENHWDQPHFRLEYRFPWLPEAARLLQSGDSWGLEEHLLSAVWDYISRLEPDVPYSLSALWLYLMQWDLVQRWCSYNAEEAVVKFEELVGASLEQPLRQLRELA